MVEQTDEGLKLLPEAHSLHAPTSQEGPQSQQLVLGEAQFSRHGVNDDAQEHQHCGGAVPLVLRHGDVQPCTQPVQDLHCPLALVGVWGGNDDVVVQVVPAQVLLLDT